VALANVQVDLIDGADASVGLGNRLQVDVASG
jgi:hypothetical protein